MEDEPNPALSELLFDPDEAMRLRFELATAKALQGAVSERKRRTALLWPDQHIATTAIEVKLVSDLNIAMLVTQKEATWYASLGLCFSAVELRHTRFPGLRTALAVAALWGMREDALSEGLARVRFVRLHGDCLTTLVWPLTFEQIEQYKLNG